MSSPPLPEPGPLPDLRDRVIVVSGASRGIGYFVARHAAAAGAHVVAIARTVGGLEDLDDEIKRDGRGVATLVPLDLTDGPGVDRLGAALNERWGRCDALVACAATLGTLAPLGHIEAKTFDTVLATNLTAVWRLCRTLDPLLTTTSGARALVLSCDAARAPKPAWGAYAASKAGLEALTRIWAAESAPTSLNVNLVDPGPTRTALRARAMPGEDRATLPEPVDVARAVVGLLDPEIDRNGELFDVRSGAWVR